MLLTVVVSFNLPGYLINFVNSYLTYCNLGKLLIVDNQSTDPQLRDYLQSIQSDRIIVEIMCTPNPKELKVGGLYLANNFALEYAKKEKYKYILLCQDDMQFIRFDQNLERNLDEIYSDDTISMVNPTIMKGVDARFFKSYEFDPVIKCWICLDYASIDVAIISVKWAVDNNFYFLNDEHKTSAALSERGFSVAVLNQPFLVYLPWPPVRRRGSLIGKDLPINDELFFRPSEKLNNVTESRAGGIPLTVRECCVPNYAKIIWPYWYTDIPYYPVTIRSILRIRYIGDGDLKIPRPYHFITQVMLGFLSRCKSSIKFFLKKFKDALNRA